MRQNKKFPPNFNNNFNYPNIINNNFQRNITPNKIIPQQYQHNFLGIPQFSNYLINLNN